MLGGQNNAVAEVEESSSDGRRDFPREDIKERVGGIEGNHNCLPPRQLKYWHDAPNYSKEVYDFLGRGPWNCIASGDGNASLNIVVPFPKGFYDQDNDLDKESQRVMETTRNSSIFQRMSC